MTWQYLAGFFDGEGCISIEKVGDGRNTYRRVRITIGQSEPQHLVIYAIADFLDDHGLHPRTYVQSYEHMSAAKPQHSLRLMRASEVRWFLEKMLPHLLVKEGQAREAIAFIQLGKTQRIAALQRRENQHA